MTDLTITELSERFYDVERTIGIVIPQEEVVAQGVAAAKFYAGFGPIASLVPPPPAPPDPPPSNDWNYLLYPGNFGWAYPYPGFMPSPRIVAGSPIAAVDWVDENTVISQSEWAVIRPLFVLYVERENAIALEASRVLGVDVYGRSSSEILPDITAEEAEMPRKAFSQTIISV